MENHNPNDSAAHSLVPPTDSSLGATDSQVIEVAIEIEIEDREEVVELKLFVDESFCDKVRAHIGLSDDHILFEHGHDIPLHQPPHSRKAIRLVAHRCKTVEVEIRYEHKTEKHSFAPAQTVYQALQWAIGTAAFNLDAVTAAKANLILPGAAAPLPREAALGKYVTPGHCALVVDLTLKDFSNG